MQTDNIRSQDLDLGEVTHTCSSRTWEQELLYNPYYMKQECYKYKGNPMLYSETLSQTNLGQGLKQ